MSRTTPTTRLPSGCDGRPPSLRARLGRWGRRWGSVALLAVGFVGAHPVAAQVSREYDLKAVFLYNLASFVEWPETAFGGPEAPFVIGVVGDDPFGSVLEEIVTGEYVGKHPFAIRRYRRASEIDGCHVLFISSSETRRVGGILARLRGRPVLTVGDMPGFVEVGGMIGFTTEREQLQLQVNPAAVQAAELNVSSKLLEVARVVGNALAFSP